MTINTNWRAQTNYEEEFLRLKLDQTLKAVIHPDMLNAWMNNTWPEDEGKLQHIDDGGYTLSLQEHHEIETGTPGSRGNRVHAHVMLYILHISNMWPNNQLLKRVLAETWDALLDDPYGDDQVLGRDPENSTAIWEHQLFRNQRPGQALRQWNVEVKYIPSNRETFEWAYTLKNKNGGNITAASLEAAMPPPPSGNEIRDRVMAELWKGVARK